jgi:hypothetical protein
MTRECVETLEASRMGALTAESGCDPSLVGEQHCRLRRGQRLAALRLDVRDVRGELRAPGGPVAGGEGGLGGAELRGEAGAGPRPETVTISFASCAPAETTVTVKVAGAEEFPCASVAVQLTVVVPIGKVLPEAGAQATSTWSPSVSPPVAV